MAIKKKYKILIATTLILLSGGLFYTFFVQIRQVKPGYVGVKADLENPTEENITEERAYAIFMPLLTDFVIYPTTIQTVMYDSMRVQSQDGAEFYIKPHISYQLTPNKSHLFYNACHSSIEDANKAYLKEIVLAAYEITIGTYSSDSLINNKLNFERNTDAILTQKLAEIGLTLKNTVSNVEVPTEIKEIVRLRAEAIQNALLAEETKKLADAEALKQFVVINGERQQDSLRNAALTPLAIQKMFLEKWDGKLPVYGDTPKLFKNITE